MNITPIILCGGSGVRLWPLSRKNNPKQFLNIIDNKNLLYQTIERILKIQKDDIIIDEVIIVTNENHRFLVLQTLDDLQLECSVKVILEPSSKNTAPALTFAAFEINEENPNTTMFVTPSDHYIKSTGDYIKTVHEAVLNTVSNRILTLGVRPSYPETGYGYIGYQGENILKNVISFYEKPTLKDALVMLKKGNFSWNSGVFILSPETWLKSIKKSKPAVYESILTSWNNRVLDFGFIKPNKTFFEQSESCSIDYAVMEKSRELNLEIKLVNLNAGWSDLGTFESISKFLSNDSNSNYFTGDVVSVSSKDNIAFSTSRNLTLVDVNDLILVETPDAVLIANKKNQTNLKKVTKILSNSHQDILSDHIVVNRPWGWFKKIEEGDNFKVKVIQINPGKSISLQKHKQRSEHWVIVKGEATITKGENVFKLKKNESTFIQKGQIHRLENKTNEILEIIEVQSGEYLGEDDIERIEDSYGR